MLLNQPHLPKFIYSLVLIACFSIAMEEPSDWLKKRSNQTSEVLSEQILETLKYAQELADKDSEHLPTYSEMKKCFDDREKKIKEELLRGGYSLELSPGVVELPILEWKSYTAVSDELDEFTMQQIEESKNKVISRFVRASKTFNHKLKSILIKGPSKSGKTAIAKLIAYRTKKPYLLIPEIFFTSTCTYQRLAIYFSYARTFKNGAVIIVENIPDMDQWADTTGIDCIRHEIVDEDAILNKNIFVIITCQDKAKLSLNLLSRIQNIEQLDLPDTDIIFEHLAHYLSPEKQINKSFLQKLATNLKSATWADINTGIMRSKMGGAISEAVINKGFKEIITRLRRQRGQIELGHFIQSFYLSNSQFPQ